MKQDSEHSGHGIAHGTRKIFYGFTVLVLISLMTSIISLFMLRWVVHKNDRMNDGKEHALLIVLRLDSAAENEATHARSFLITGNRQSMLSMDQSNAEFHQLMSEAVAGTNDSEARHLLESLKKAKLDEQNAVDQAINLKLHHAGPLTIQRFVDANVRPRYHQVNLSSEILTEYMQQSVDQARTQISQTSSGLMTFLCIIGLASFITGCALTILVFKTLRRIRETESALSEALVSRDDFLSIASHELKNPMTALRLQLQLLQTWVAKGDYPGIVHQCVNDAERNCTRLVSLLGELLDLTKIRIGRIQLHREEMNLEDVVREVIDDVRAEYPQAVDLITLTTESDVNGSWDRLRITQVITNLITNAVKYGAGRPIEVTVGLQNSEQLAILSVKDHGLGIPEHLQTKVFERFERAVGGESPIKGLGLGLYIVKQIVLAHGGRIRLQSVHGQGSTFIIEMPCRAVKTTALSRELSPTLDEIDLAQRSR